jgi:hypothetical protein
VQRHFDSVAKTLAVQSVNCPRTVETGLDFFGNQSAF